MKNVFYNYIPSYTDMFNIFIHYQAKLVVALTKKLAIKAFKFVDLMFISLARCFEFTRVQDHILRFIMTRVCNLLALCYNLAKHLCE